MGIATGRIGGQADAIGEARSLPLSLDPDDSMRFAERPVWAVRALLGIATNGGKVCVFGVNNARAGQGGTCARGLVPTPVSPSRTRAFLTGQPITAAMANLIP